MHHNVVDIIDNYISEVKIYNAVDITNVLNGDFSTSLVTLSCGHIILSFDATRVIITLISILEKVSIGITMLIGYHNVPGVLIVYYQKPSDLWHSCSTNVRSEKCTEGQHHNFFDMYSTWSHYFPTVSVNMKKIDPALFLGLIILLCRKPLIKPKKCCL